MKIDYCLILAAGFGTRMGEIGKELPKVLWPIFEKPLLELEILYARSLGIKKIFINLHHQADKISSFIQSISNDDIILLYEPAILDVGGAIQNLAIQKAINYRGNLLVLNSDQFLFFDKNYFEDGIKLLNTFPVCPFMIQVNKSGNYNQVVLKEENSILYFSKIIKSSDIIDQIFWTYSGNALINLEKIPQIQGKTNFYESVACFEKELIPVIKLEKISYWDFGTLSRYTESLVNILKKLDNLENDAFIDFLLKTHSLDLKKVDLKSQSYNSEKLKVLDFLSFGGPKLSLSPDCHCIEYGDLKISI